MKRTKTPVWTLASFALHDAYTDFMLSRQAMQCTSATLEWYQYTAGKFLEWVESQSVTSPEQVTARHVRQYLSLMIDAGKQDTTLHAHARAIRTLLKFWNAEGYMQPVKFDMPKLSKKRLPVLTVEQLQSILKACNVRDNALVLFMVDSGLRRAETIALNWDDVDLHSGLVRVKSGKGGKARSTVVGVKVRRALLKYRRTLSDFAKSDPLFRTRTGTRFTREGFSQIFDRLTKRTGIYVTPHALRRTFTILALRAGMRPLHLQHLGGWADLSMVDHYAQMIEDDLLQEHKAHSPIDNLT